ncbi:MAG: glycosyltransferase [Planctomycetes bacterium]|nr:glycosyltransferase [Planctomycetota bacterium]
MRVLMLGWEFPPYISGGLGTACYGLTKALDKLGVEVTFVLPKAVDRSLASHVTLLSPESGSPYEMARAVYLSRRVAEGVSVEQAERELRATGLLSSDADSTASGIDAQEFDHVTFQAVPARFSSPYGDQSALTEQQIRLLRRIETGEADPAEIQTLREELRAVLPSVGPEAGMAAAPGADDDSDADAANAPTPGFLGLHRQKGSDYDGDLIGDVRRYADLCLALTRNADFDVIHAHDWMTYPAGMAVARVTGKPLIVQVHSTEFDRSGENVNQQVYEIERRGMHSAMRVVTVSYWTKNIVQHRYGVNPEQIRVVWNGVDLQWQNVSKPAISSTDKIVLFLGRITMQKGPEYFLGAAKRVLEVMDNVKFIIAGSGDLVTRTIELAARMGIGHKVLFTGFLRGEDVARVYKMADCYVMPSVSEPFGLAPLEAMSHDVPVIISKQSGVSECLTHVLKVDFWDIDEMANKILAVLRHPPLSQTLRQHGGIELHHITWEGAAAKCSSIYEEAVAGMALATSAW